MPHDDVARSAVHLTESVGEIEEDPCQPARDVTGDEMGSVVIGSAQTLRQPPQQGQCHVVTAVHQTVQVSPRNAQQARSGEGRGGRGTCATIDQGELTEGVAGPHEPQQ